MTLGFRGEALAAISSVSKMTVITKTKTSDTASMLTAEAGEVTDVSEVYAADGTTVVVSDLFYNVPARRKFLKKDATEAMNVTALLERVALSRPDISIQLLIDGEERFKTPGDSKLENAIYAVFGRDFASKMIAADGTAGAIRVHGYVGRSDNVRRNRNYINVFINGRYVKSLTAQAAIEKAYTSYIAPEAFPVCVLFIEMNPRTVDVNVHPAKLEVKFTDERAVFEAVYYTVREALTTHEYRPEMTLTAPKKNPLERFIPIGETNRAEQIAVTDVPIRKSEPTVHSNERYSDGIRAQSIREPIRFSSGVGTLHREAPSVTPSARETMLERKTQSTEITENPIAEQIPKAPLYRYIGEAFDCYVIIEYEGALLVVDKHAAHERIIFEDLKRGRNADGRIASQSLLIPITPPLSPEELTAASEFGDELRAVGFDFNLVGERCEIVAVPEAISIKDAESLFVAMTDEIVAGLGSPKNTDELRRERALYQVACKAAIKGGRVYDRAVIDWLIGRLLALPDVTVCPHGRPVAFRLTKSELDRRFERLK